MTYASSTPVVGWLSHHRRGGEDEIGDNNDPGDLGDGFGVAAQMRHEHEERNPSAGAEQHSRADHMQEFQDEIDAHPSSRIASATAMRTAMGPILSMGPSGCTGDENPQSCSCGIASR